MEAVLKTVVANNYREFESLIIREVNRADMLVPFSVK